MLKKAEKPENVQPAAKRKLTRAERKQIEAIIRQAKGDGKPHTVQDSIPFRNMYPDGLCRLDDRLFSKTIAYEDVNYRLAGSDDQRNIFERLPAAATIWIFSRPTSPPTAVRQKTFCRICRAATRECSI